MSENNNEKELKLPDNYWKNKTIAYLHDPLDKVLDIVSHEMKTITFMEFLGFSKEEIQGVDYAKFDWFSAGSDRGSVLRYNWDKQQDGSVDFNLNPVITHPIGSKFYLNLKKNKNNENNYISVIPDETKNDPRKLFYYIYFILRFKLAKYGDMGALWHRLPADTRFPDHSIWQHNSLTSAAFSCANLSENNDNKNSLNNLGILAVSISPVQPFIMKARKLRDFWTGSVLLSWLAFEGMRWVIENLGPDHILYPSLIDQPLVKDYLLRFFGDNEIKDDVENNDISDNKDTKKENDKICKDIKYSLTKQVKGIASLPNKFSVLIPIDKAQIIAENIQESIKTEWKKLVDLVKDDIINELNNEEKKIIENIFKNQYENFWDISWGAVPLLELKENNNKYEIDNNIKDFLNETMINKILKIAELFKPNITQGICYSLSHTLSQSILASAKQVKKTIHKEEHGEKCMMCGEFEVLNTFDTTKKGFTAKEYSESIKNFWKKISDKYGKNDFKDNERLCSVCLTKRLLPIIIRKDEDKNHILNNTFSGAINFPSTTEISLYNFFKRNKISDINKKIKIAQEIHDDKNEDKSKYENCKINNQDKYYAILLMDGDNMGKLINGETIAATWESTLHPEYLKKLNDKNFNENEKEKWQKIFNDNDFKLNKRSVTPAIHCAISEALGDFSIYAVPEIIKKYDGRLIYAGGDDVCAVLPIENAINAAEEIRNAYHRYFYVVKEENDKTIIKEISKKDNETETSWTIEKGKLSIGLGKGDGISISAGILICHHKEPLSWMLKEAHNLLDNVAKKISGKDSIAIELKKRSGGSRIFYSKWDGKELKSFKDLIKIKEKDLISNSLLYKISDFEAGIIATLNKNQNKIEITNETKLLVKEIVKKSDVQNIAIDKVVDNILNVIKINKNSQNNNDNNKNDKEELSLDTSGLIIASFLSGIGDNNEKDEKINEINKKEEIKQ